MTTARGAGAIYALPVGVDDGPRRPALSERWLRDAALANRLAFEREMKKGRRERLDSRLDRYLKRISARQA